MPAEVEFVTIHGYRRAFRRAGSGPVLLLIHGLGCDSTTWDPVFDQLAESFTVIAPDLLGHGQSDKPRADYSVGGYANAMRDLLSVLDIDHATVIGHSFGGGVAQQFLYQYPTMVERLVLVASGGLGSDVTPLIRFLTLPGSGPLLAAVATWPLRPIVATGMSALSKLPLWPTHDLDEVAKIYSSLGDPATRSAVQHVTKHVLDWRGQFVTALDRRYLAGNLPVLLIWGEEDMVLPVRHARRIAARDREEVVIIDDAAHFPYRDDPASFIALVCDFVAAQPAAEFNEDCWRAALKTGDRAIESALEVALESAG